MKLGKVEKIETDYVIIKWEDDTTTITDLKDDDNKTFHLGDKVQFIPYSPWEWQLPRITIIKEHYANI